MACGLALLASGQAMAVNQLSIGNGTDFTTAANWDDVPAACPGTAAGTAPTAADTFLICPGHTIALGAANTVDGVTVKAGVAGTLTGGTLALGTFALTATTRLQVDESMVAGGAGGTVTSSSATTAHQLGMLVVGMGMPGATGPVANLGGAQIAGNVILNTGTLTLGSNSSVGGNLTIDAGTFAGTLRFTDANHTINAQSAAKTIPNLNLSLMTTPGRTITIHASGQNVTFANVAGGSLSCTPTGGAAAAYTTGQPIAPGTVCTVTAGGGGGGGTVSAPIFSTKEKPAVFSEEVK